MATIKLLSTSEDTVIEAPATDGVVSYNVLFKSDTSTTEEVVYSGKAYSEADDTLSYLFISRIVAQLLRNSAANPTKYAEEIVYGSIKKVRVVDTLLGTELYIGIAVCEWTYGSLPATTTAAALTLNDPARTTLPAGAFAPMCVWSPQASAAVRPVLNGVTKTAISIADILPRRIYRTMTEGGSAKIIDSGGNTIGPIWTGVAACKGQYVIYYVNKLGGMDAFMCTGNRNDAQTYSRQTVERMRENTLGEHVTDTWLTAVKDKWTLTTGIMTAAEAAKMGDILGSPFVFLYEAESGEYIPVTVQDSSVTFKVAVREGKPVSYDIVLQRDRSTCRR